jgi:hypothetical protein
MAVQQVTLLDLETARVRDMAALAVMSAIVAIDGGVRGREQLRHVGGHRGLLSGSEPPCTAEQRLETHGHLLF